MAPKFFHFVEAGDRPVAPTGMVRCAMIRQTERGRVQGLEADGYNNEVDESDTVSS